MCVIHLQLDLIYIHKKLLIPEDKNLLTSHWAESCTTRDSILQLGLVQYQQWILYNRRQFLCMRQHFINNFESKLLETYDL